MSNDLITQQSSNEIIFSAEKAGELIKFAEFMSSSQVMVPKHLQGKPADCMAIAMQAAAWGMSPFVVAQKTHLVNGTLGYEAQLVNAVISSSRAIIGRFHYRTIGDWSKWNAPVNGEKKGTNEHGLAIQVGAILSGETEITWDDPLYLETIDIRNSPLWKTRPLQQIKYLGVKYWARIYCPEVILGVYTPDDLYDESEYNANRGTEKVINPKNDNVNTVHDIFDKKIDDPETKHDEYLTAQDIFSSPYSSQSKSDAKMLIDQINDCDNINALNEIGQYMTTHAASFSTDELTEIRASFKKTKSIIEGD